MDRLLAARVREGEAITVQKRRTLLGRVVYADAIPSRYMPPSGAAAGDADATAAAHGHIDAGTGPVAGKAPR